MNWKRNVLVAACGLSLCAAVSAAPTNLPVKADYAFFSLVSDRNIFNPNRYPHRARTGRTEIARTTPADTFALVGTISYEKGTFAFFTGATADYQKVLECSGEIAGFNVAAIQPDAVLLAVSNNVVMKMPVGAQLHRDADAGWELVQGTGSQPVERAEAPAMPPAAEDTGGNPGDILKKLMQKREQEMQ